MFVRSGLLAIALAPLFVMSGAAQTPMSSEQPAQHRDSLSYQPPTLDQLARQGYGPYLEPTQSCQVSRQQLRAAYFAKRRADEQARREASRARLPLPIRDDERLAKAKVELAHQLWLSGKTDAAGRWLDEITTKFPQTEMAARAAVTLARLDVPRDAKMAGTMSGRLAINIGPR